MVVGEWVSVGEWVFGGDWARMYEIMADGGVCGIGGEEELVDDADDSETSECDLLRVTMVMGSERIFVDFSFEDI